MKRLVCEMCGGSDLVKQDGVFVCQNCGTKYSVEEAKKMMVEGAVTVEGTVAVEGTVKVDKSKELENLYVLARRAKEADNTDNACRYYTQIEMQDPNSWEAYFYLIYFKARTTKIADIPKDCKNLANSFGTTLDLLFKSNNEEEDVRKALNMIFEDIKYIADLMFNSINTLTSGEYSSEALLDSFQYKEPVLSMMDKLGESIATHKQYADIAVQVWKSEIELFMSYYGSSTRYDAVKGTYAYFVKGSTTMLGYSGVPVTYLITDVPKKIYEFDLSYEDPFGITKKLRRNEKFITCPKCGATMRERESKCPQCGTPKEEIQRLIAEKEAAEAAERERLRKEREAKEAEEARIRAEKRAEWWKKNGKKVWITIAIIAAIILAIIAVNKIQNAIAERQLNQKVEAAFLSGDSCVNVFAFEEAEKFYEQAMELKNDGATSNRVAKKRTELSNVKQKADKDYDAALRKLKILLDADDNEFNQYSNECLDKMIEIYPDRQETINYKNIRPTSLSAVPDYEKQGDELFARAQYEKAKKKYKATEVVTELRGQAISAQLKEKKDKLSKCMDLIRKAIASEDNQQYEEAEMFYSEIYAVHALPIYKQKATEYKRKLQVEQARNAQKNESQTFGKKIDYIDVIISSGGLSQIWSDDDAMTIKSLRIHGTMDARDFDYIRWHCMDIENIDLHDVTITAYTGAYGTNEGYNATYNANEIPLGAFFYWKNSYHHTTTKATSDRGMPSIKKVVLPNGITAIRRNAFARASNLEDINIPEGVTVIDWVAFSICSSIKKFILPSSLKNLGKAVFHATPALKELHLRGTTPPTFSSNTFDSSHYDNVTLFVPASALSTYKASEWKMFKNIVGE